MDYITIKSKRQDNGLWGTPMNVSNMKLDSLRKGEEAEKFSAVIMGMCEAHGNSCTIVIEDIKTTGFIRFDIYNSELWENDSKTFINLNHYGLIDNKLYFIKEDKNRLMYNRMLKLNQLKQKVVNNI